MKSRAPRSPSTTTPSLCTFLKPGALAQIRYSKIAAKTRAKYARTLITLSQIKPISSNQNHGDDGVNGVVGFEEIPGFLCSFKSRYQPPRCLIRKKLVAAMPIFTES